MFNNEPALQLLSLLTPGCQNRVVAMGTRAPRSIKGQGIRLRKTGTYLHLWRMRCDMREIVGDRGWGRRISSPHSMSECLETEHKFIIRWLKSLETSKWLHGCATPLIWSAFSLDIYERASTRPSKTHSCEDPSNRCCCSRSTILRLFHLSQQRTELSERPIIKQHGFHPDEEIVTIIKSMCLYLGT